MGALVVRHDPDPAAGDPRGRSGEGPAQRNPNVAGIVGMAAALTATVAQRSEATTRITALRDRLGDTLVAGVPGVVETVERHTKVAGHLHIRFAGVESEALVVLLDQAGVAVSAGAACSSGAWSRPATCSPPWASNRHEAVSGVRFSLGSTTTGADIERVMHGRSPGVVAQLRD